MAAAEGFVVQLPQMSGRYTEPYMPETTPGDRNKRFAATFRHGFDRLVQAQRSRQTQKTSGEDR